MDHRMDLYETRSLKRFGSKEPAAVMAVKGGWVYIFQYEEKFSMRPLPPVFAADPTAPHCKAKTRWFKAKPTTTASVRGLGWELRNHRIEYLEAVGLWKATRSDYASSYHPTREAAHDALGENSPLLEVFDVVREPEQAESPSVE